MSKQSNAKPNAHGHRDYPPYVHRSKPLLVYEHFKSIERYTTLCAQNVLKTILGKNDVRTWLDALIEEDKNHNFNDQIFKEKRDLESLDSQAILKIFYYRKTFLKQYIEKKEETEQKKKAKSNEDSSGSSTPKETKQEKYRNIIFSGKFGDLVISVINIRNDISAHTRTKDIATLIDELPSDKGYEFIVIIKNACEKMIEFINCFPTETYKNDNRTFLDKAKEELEQITADLRTTSYDVGVVIDYEGLDIDLKDFLLLSYPLKLTVNQEKGKYLFFTDDYDRDIINIKSYIETTRAEKEADEANKRAEAADDKVAEADQRAAEAAKRADEATKRADEAVKRANELAQSNSEQKDNKKVVLIALCALFVICAIIIALLIGFLSKDTQGSGAQTSPSAQDAVNTPETIINNESVAPNGSGPLTKFKGEGSFDELTFSVNQKTSNVLKIAYQNGKSSDYSLGWVRPIQVIVETTEATYYGTILDAHVAYTINKNDSGEFKVVIDEDINGTIKSITIDDLLLLDDRGLPVNGASGGQKVKIKVTYYE